MSNNPWVDIPTRRRGFEAFGPSAFAVLTCVTPAGFSARNEHKAFT